MNTDNVRKYLDAFLGHITESELDALSGGEGITCDIRDNDGAIYGAWVYVTGDLGEIDAEIFPNIIAIMRVARELGCDWICLDEDGPILDGLPTFETDFCDFEDCPEYPRTGEKFCPEHKAAEAFDALLAERGVISPGPAPAKTCAKCGQPVPEPMLDGFEAERCSGCAD